MKTGNNISSQQQTESTDTTPYFSPLVDIYETKEAVIVLAEIPGVKQDHIDISLEENVLTLNGKVVTPCPEGKIVVHEYETGHFLRKFTVAETIDQDSISASLVNGMLKVVLPKLLPVTPKKIDVQLG